MCDGPIASSARGRSRLCEGCVLAKAFEPNGAEVEFADSDQPWRDVDAPMLGPYALMEEIGRGGMGVIYRATHGQTRKVVALKTVLPQYSKDLETLARFRREAETARGLDHPHTMSILDVGCSESGLPFFTMPVAPGGSLRHLLAKYRGRWRRIAELMVKVARGVHHAHHRGVLHRDIKPGNILFTEDYEPLVTDFGLAKPLVNSDDLTRFSEVLGTPSYLAPELAAGKTRDLTPGVDVYSLGAVLYELLTGCPPFVGSNPLETLEKIGKQTPLRSRCLVPAVPKTLDQICARCLERDPANRYLSALQLADDLERWLDGRTVTPRPRSLRLRSFFGRHPLVMVCGVVGALLFSLPFALRIAARPTASAPTTSIALVIDQLEPSATAKHMTRELTRQLTRELSASGTFRVQEPPEDRSVFQRASLDPLAYGRSVSVQTVLTIYLRRAGDQLHLMTQFVRCDTGETIWRRRNIIALDQQTTTNLPPLTHELVGHLKQSWEDRYKSKANIHSEPLAEAKNFYTHAMELTVHGSRRDMEAATDLLQRARKIDPQYAQACAMLALVQWTMGYVYGESDQFDLAAKTAKQALALDPDSAQAHRVIASCYLQQARCDLARAEFEIAVELAPESSGCYQALGVCLRQMGHPEQGISWLRRAVQLEPARGSASAILGESLILCDLDEEAEAAFTRAAQLNVERADTQFGMVALRVWQKRYDEARDLCAEASRRFPDYNFQMDFAAWTEFCGGHLAEAKSCYEALRTRNIYRKQWTFHGAINPASALAYIADRCGSSEQSRSLAEEALTIDRELLGEYPDNNRILHDIAATYAVIGNEQEALRYLQKALSAGWAEHRSTQIDPRFRSIADLRAFKTLLAATKPIYRASDSD